MDFRNSGHVQMLHCFLSSCFRSFLRYLAAKKLDFLAQNHLALRHKHGFARTWPKYVGFDCRAVRLAHSAIAVSKKRSLQTATANNEERVAFVPGDSVLARRRARRGESGGETWGEAELLDGWYPAEVVKVRKAGTDRALYNVRG